MATRSKALRLVVAIGIALLLALLAGLAIQALRGQSDDGSSTDESTEIADELQPQLRERIAVASAYQPFVQVPVACAGGEIEFSAGPAEWRDVTGFRIPLAWSATRTNAYAQFAVDAYDPAGNSWLIDAGTYDSSIEIYQYVDGADTGQENVEGRVAGPQRDAAGIALLVTSLNGACQEEFILLLVSLDSPG